MQMLKSPKVITLMTALVPTVGHKFLIDFCRSLATGIGGEAHIILGALPREPIDGNIRFAALDLAFQDGSTLLHYLDEDLPQDPSEHADFWEVWRKVVEDIVGPVGPDDIFVASELYGMDMARVLNCKFMPCNRYREILPVKGSDVRSDLLGRFDQIMPTFQPYLRRTVTLFGAESCGKTTMAKRLAKDMNGHFVPEWAREYLETVGPETTDDRMLDIVLGQDALQRAAKSLIDKPWIFQDTDLLSTLGYYQIFGGASRRPADYKSCLVAFNESKSDLYVVMNTNIPFEQDPLRYGGDKRESDMAFWISLLKEYDCNYIVAPSGSHEEQTAWLKAELLKFYHEETKHISEYVR